MRVSVEKKRDSGRGSAEGRHRLQVLFFLALGLLAGCAGTGYMTARVYNIDTGELLNVRFYGYETGKGNLRAELPHGKVLYGRYTLMRKELKGPQAPSASGLIRVKPVSAQEPTLKIRATAERPEINEPFGVRRDNPVVEIILDSASTAASGGEGIARNANAEWFRVQIRGSEE